MLKAKRRWTSEDIEKLKAMAGKFPRETIAAELGRGPSSVSVKAHQLHVSLRWRTAPRYSGAAGDAPIFPSTT